MPEQISIDEFTKVDLRVARVIAAEDVPQAKKLLKLTLSLGGPHRRTVFAGIKSAYRPEDLVGRRVICVVNLAPRQMKFGLSEGMILAAGAGGSEIHLFGARRGRPARPSRALEGESMACRGCADRRPSMPTPATPFSGRPPVVGPDDPPERHSSRGRGQCDLQHHLRPGRRIPGPGRPAVGLARRGPDVYPRAGRAWRLPCCIRVLVHWNTEKSGGEIVHVYIKEAARLRPDLQKLPPVDWGELESWIADHLDVSARPSRR